MTFPDEIARVAVNWSADPGSWNGEIAVNTFYLRHKHVTGENFSWSTAVQYAANQVVNKLVSHWGSLATYHGAGFAISGVKVSQLDSAGKVVAEGFAAPTSDTPLHGTATAVLPPEVAVCLSLYGYTPGGFTDHRGRKRGRIYLPYISAQATDDKGKIRSSVVTAMLNDYGSFFNDIQGMHTDGSSAAGLHDSWDLVVVSSVAAGLATQVSYLTMDDHFDSQRRRQHQTPPIRSSQVINH